MQQLIHLTKSIDKKIFLLTICWFFLFASLGVNIQHAIGKIFNFEDTIGSDFISVHFLRSFSVLIVFGYLLFLFIKNNFKDISFQISLENYFFLAIFLYLISSLIGLSVSCYYPDGSLSLVKNICTNGIRNNFIFPLHFIIVMFSSLIIFLNILKNNEFLGVLSINIVTMTFLILLAIIILLNADMSYGGFNFVFPFSSTPLYMNSNGAGRTLIIVLIFLQSLIFSKYSNNIFTKFSLVIFSILISVFILSFEGRANILGMLASTIFFSLIVFKDLFWKKLIYLFILLIIPFFIFNKTVELKKKNVGKNCFIEANFNKKISNEMSILKKKNNPYYINVNQEIEKFKNREISYTRLIYNLQSSLPDNIKSTSVEKEILETVLFLKHHKQRFSQCVKINYFNIFYNTNRFLKSFGFSEKLDDISYSYIVYSDGVKVGEENIISKIKNLNKKELSELNIILPDSKTVSKRLSITKDIKISDPNSRKIQDTSYHMTSRGEKWFFITNNIINRKSFFGNGPEYDRVIMINRIKEIQISLTKNEKNFAINSDAANALIYAIASGGIFGVIFYIFIIFCFLKIILFYIINYNRTHSFLFNFAFVCLGFLLFRSIFESSFSSWNIDFLVLINSSIIIFNYKKLLK